MSYLSGRCPHGQKTTAVPVETYLEGPDLDWFKAQPREPGSKPGSYSGYLVEVALECRLCDGEVTGVPYRPGAAPGDLVSEAVSARADDAVESEGKPTCVFCRRPFDSSDALGRHLRAAHWRLEAEPRPRLELGSASDYASLRSVLARAHAQASSGKGVDRHGNGKPFEQQLIVTLGQELQGSTDFNVGQACKKAIEAKRLPVEKAVAELLGAINYLAGAVIILESRPVTGGGATPGQTHG